MKSITGIEYNNPEVCIKGISVFACACVCDNCTKEMRNKLKEYVASFETPIKLKVRCICK